MAEELILQNFGEFSGIAKGDVRVSAGSRYIVGGIINGNLIVEAGAAVQVKGIVNGRIINEGAEISVSGIVDGGR